MKTRNVLVTKLLKTRNVLVGINWALEGEVTTSTGDIVYANICVNNLGEQEELYEDGCWTYTVPVDKVDFENPDDYLYDKVDMTSVYEELLNVWNSNPKIDDAQEWKEIV